MFSDEKGVCPRMAQAIDISLRVNSAFDDEQPVIRNELGQAKRSIQADVEGFQIAVVHADDGCSCFQNLTQLRFVVNLGQNIKVELLRKADQFFQIAKLEHGGDQEHCARSPSTCLIDLDGFPYEILSQDRQACGGPDLVDPSQIAMKEIFFRDHRHGTGARVDIRTRKI